LANHVRVTKEQTERMIFDAVYDSANFVEVEHRDRPDFIIYRRANREMPFGVEITELFDDESHARLQNISGYFEELIAGKPHRHKDDMDELKVEKMKILDPDGNPKGEFMGIFQPVTGRPTLPTMLADRISSKNENVTAYLSAGLTHVNLIVHDRTHQPERPKRNEAFPARTYLSAESKRTLSRCAFNEVHVISRDSDGNEVVRGLRALAMVEAAYTMGQAGKKAAPPTIDYSDEDVHLLFIAACARQGLALDYVVDSEGIRAQFGGISVQFTEEHIRLLDRTNFPKSPPSERPELGLDPLVADGILDSFDDYATNYSFSCVLGSPAVRTFAESRAVLGIGGGAGADEATKPLTERP
jgi:hypothetical protein